MDDLDQSLHESLDHLYDPAYQPAEVLAAVLGRADQSDRDALRAAIIRAIEELKPPADTPPEARTWRIYNVLFYRYVKHVTQEDVGERLGITSRHLRREQHDAVRVLAAHLLRRQSPAVPQTPPEQPVAPLDWRAQVRQDLEALERDTASPAANVAGVLAGVAGLLRDPALRRSVELRTGNVDESLVVAAHPSALRQVLVTGIAALAQRMTAGAIVLNAQAEGNQARVTIVSTPACTPGALPAAEMTEFLAPHGGLVYTETTGDSCALVLELPLASMVTVLAIDDNADLVHVYKRYVMGTRYRIATLPSGQGTLEAIVALAPGIIVLDIMLPDVDGWELLTQLHEHPETREIPVIVCSVVRQEELALALGAAAHLAKPVLREQFVMALEQAAPRAGAGSPTGSG